ncbi:MAG TPA: dipeptidase [Paracoccaceae bacterium]|nr:dipeptidase [Paracoccaceae bacterium]HMO72180.1 dipeptidase [Paracoccaceae bacterium]
MTIPVFDGHNDFLLRLWRRPDRATLWLAGEGRGHLDLPRMRAGGFAGGMFAIYVPSPDDPALRDIEALMDRPPYAVPLPPALDLHDAQPVAMAMAAHLLGMERDAPADFRICRDAAEVRTAIGAGAIAGVMHMEGAEAIDEGLDALHLFHALGLRSLGPVWSRPTAFGHGVPFAFPASPDHGPGLTDAGRRLVAECDALRILIDLSHLNEAGFWDVARLSQRPLVATHSNAHAVTPSSRNLTDRQLAAIRDSGGLVGLNFATAFLRPDGRRDPKVGWDALLRHLDHLLSVLGEGGVGLGSDFDGATIPEPIGDAAGLPGLLEALSAHGFGEALVTRIAHRNWLDLLARTWGG